MRIGVYVDGYNLYYGARKHCGRSTAGWRWLDVRALVEPLAGWQDSRVTRLVYCTARVDPLDSPEASLDQSIYLDALLAARSVDVIAEGRYVSWAKAEPLVTGRPGTFRPRVHLHEDEVWDRRLPLRAVTAGDDRLLMATVRKREEKGSDVNVASHLLFDVLTDAVDGAVVVSNDSVTGGGGSRQRTTCEASCPILSGDCASRPGGDKEKTRSHVEKRVGGSSIHKIAEGCSRSCDLSQPPSVP